MRIKIEISGIGLREHVAKIIARQIVKTGIKENKSGITKKLSSAS